MLLPAKCPACSHEYSIDSGYLGATRKCPECGEKFVFEVAGKAGESALPLKLACPHCLREFQLKKIFSESDNIPCAFCGEYLTKEEGLAALRLAADAAECSRGALLAGESAAEVKDRLVRMGVGEDLAETYAGNELRRLPFVRFELHGAKGSERPSSPEVCDLCGHSIGGQLKRECHIVRWHCPFKQDSDDEDGLGFGFTLFFHSGAYVLMKMASSLAGSLLSRGLGNSRLQDNELMAMYFLCRGCESAIRARVFGKYSGYPADSGFRVVGYEKRLV